MRDRDLATEALLRIIVQQLEPVYNALSNSRRWHADDKEEAADLARRLFRLLHPLDQTLRAAEQQAQERSNR